MNALFQIIKIASYTVVSMTVRKGWNWLTANVDPIPGTKEFNQEYESVKSKYQHMRKQKEEYEAYRKSR